MTHIFILLQAQFNIFVFFLNVKKKKKKEDRFVSNATDNSL